MMENLSENQEADRRSSNLVRDSGHRCQTGSSVGFELKLLTFSIHISAKILS
jgi:hypothetical protein